MQIWCDIFIKTSFYAMFQVQIVIMFHLILYHRIDAKHQEKTIFPFLWWITHWKKFYCNF